MRRNNKASLKSTVLVTIAVGVALGVAGNHLPSQSVQAVKENNIIGANAPVIDESMLPSNKAPIMPARKTEIVKNETIEMVY